MPRFPRIKPEPKVEKPRPTLKPCIDCGKGLGTCRGGWCQRCVDNWTYETSPKVEDLRQPNEMYARRAFKGDHRRRLNHEQGE